MSQNQEIPVRNDSDPNVTACANCHMPMPIGLRFCRNCGYRLGEGSAEYTETARFQNGRPVAQVDSPTAPQAYTTTYGLSGEMVAGAGGYVAKRKKKISGMTWMFIGLLAFFLAAAVFTAIVAPMRPNIGPGIGAPPAAPRGYVGVNSFETTDGGVTFETVEPPGSPADKAGLVGGDIITTFDGKTVKSEDEIMDLIRQTPIGKTVDVIYLRDGETKTTKLSTVADEERRRLEREFRNRPEGSGLFGFDDDDVERVPIEGTKLFGIRLDEITQNRPADMAGIKEGDVVIAFDKVPIRTRGEFSSRVRRAVPYSTVTVTVMRGQERLEIPVKMGRQ